MKPHHYLAMYYVTFCTRGCMQHGRNVHVLCVKFPLSCTVLRSNYKLLFCKVTGVYNLVRTNRHIGFLTIAVDEYWLLQILHWCC